MRYRSVIDMHVVNRMQAFGWPPVVGGRAGRLGRALRALVGPPGPGPPARL